MTGCQLFVFSDKIRFSCKICKLWGQENETLNLRQFLQKSDYWYWGQCNQEILQKKPFVICMTKISSLRTNIWRQKCRMRYLMKIWKYFRAKYLRIFFRLKYLWTYLSICDLDTPLQPPGGAKTNEIFKDDQNINLRHLKSEIKMLLMTSSELVQSYQVS